MELKRQQEDAKAQVARCDDNLARLKVEIANQKAGKIIYYYYFYY